MSFQTFREQLHLLMYIMDLSLQDHRETSAIPLDHADPSESVPALLHSLGFHQPLDLLNWAVASFWATSNTEREQRTNLFLQEDLIPCFATVGTSDSYGKFISQCPPPLPREP